MRHVGIFGLSRTGWPSVLTISVLLGCGVSNEGGVSLAGAGGSVGAGASVGVGASVGAGASMGAPGQPGIGGGGQAPSAVGTVGAGGTVATGIGGSAAPPAGTPAATGGTPIAAGPVDCGAIEDHSDWELCDSGPDFCAAVFTDGSGCTAVCAAVGLACAEVWENVQDECAADTDLAALSCGSPSGHESDYCVCRGSGSGVVVPGTGGTSSVTPSTGGTSSVTPSTGGTSTVTPGTGGAPSTGGTSSTGGSMPDVGPGPCGCETPAGEYGDDIDDTIVVGSGEVYDGGCKIFRANPSTLGPGDQTEGQGAVFDIEDGGTLRNVVLGASAADGIHTMGDATLENVHWLDIGEDALTVEGSGTVTINCGSATAAEDKMFQVNAESEIHITNFTGSNAGKFMRQNGDTTFFTDVYIDHCDISDMDEVIFRTDSTSSHVTLTNSRYSGLGDGLFMFGSSVVNGNSDQSTVSNNEEY